MKNSSSTEFTASEGRRFAFPVGGAFLLLALVLWWRERTALMWIAAAAGTSLALSGALVPARLGPIYRGWMRLAQVISKVTTPIFMAVVYFGVFTPFGWLMRLFGGRPIVHRVEGHGYWRSRTDRESDLRRQF